jgi:small subunit ribosomal protein S20
MLSVDTRPPPGYVAASSEESMAEHRSAEKQHRQSLKRRARNKSWRTRVRRAVRQLRASKAQGRDDLLERFRQAERLLRKAASKGVVHKRTVSRTVSRLHRLVGS